MTAAVKERIAAGLPALPPISEYYSKPEIKTDFWHTPAIDLLGPTGEQTGYTPAAVFGFPRIPPIGAEGSKLRAASEFAGGVEEAALGSLSGMTTREAILTYPLFSVPFVGPALALGLGAKAVGSGLGKASVGLEQGEPRTAGEGVGEAGVGALMLAGGAEGARGPISEATPAGRLAAELNRAEFRPPPTSIEGEAPGLTPARQEVIVPRTSYTRRLAAELAREQGIPVEERPPVPIPPPVPTAEAKLAADVQAYNDLQAQFQAFVARGDFASPEFQSVFKQIEDLKNQYGGAVPGRALAPEPTTRVSPEIGSEIPNSFIGRTVAFTRQFTTTSTPQKASAKVVKATRREDTRGGSQMVEVHYDDGSSTAVNAGLQSDGRFIPWDEGIDYAIKVKGKLEPAEKGAPSAIHIETEGAVRPVQQPGGTPEGAGEVPAIVSGAQTGARGGGTTGTPTGAEVKAPATSPAVGEVTVEAGKFPYQFKIGQEVWDAWYQKKGVVVDRRSSMIQIGDGDEVPLQWVPGGPGQVKLRYADGKEEWQGAQWVRESGQPTRADIEVEGAVVPPKQLAGPAGRISLRSNIPLELPEFTIERMRRGVPEPHTGEVNPAKLVYNPVGTAGQYLSIRGQTSHTSYKIPLDQLPAGSWAKVAGGIEVDKQAVLDFLNDPVKRFSNRNLSRNAKYFHPDDINEIAGVTKLGRPIKTAEEKPAPLPKPGVKPGAPPQDTGRRPMMDITRRAFDDLRAKNPALIEHLLERRPEELDDAFWNSIHAELSQMPAFQRPGAPEALVENLRRLKERGDLEWQAIIQGPVGDINNPDYWEIRYEPGFYKGTPWVVTDATNPKGDPTLSFAEFKTLEEAKAWLEGEKTDYTREMQGMISHGWESEGGRTTYTSDADSLAEARQLIDSPKIKGWLTPETTQVLRDILDSPVAGYLNGRQIKFRITDAIRGDPKMAGAYDPVTQTIEIVARAKPLIAAHEFFHPLWDMIQDADRANVNRWRAEAIAKAMETATGKDLADLQKLAAGEMGYRQFFDEGIAHKFYRLSSTEEYFAHMMTDRFGTDRQGIWGQTREILASQDAFLAKVRQIIGVIFDAIRQRVPGLRTQADILQRTILDGKYEVLPETALQAREVQGALESREKVEEYVDPLEQHESPTYYRGMASTINKGLVPPAAVERFNAMPEGVREEMSGIIGDRIGTHQEGGRSMREILADPSITPERKADLARNGLAELVGYQRDKAGIIARRDKTIADLDEATLKAIEAIPETNEAQVRAVNRLGSVLDRINAERVGAAEGAVANERIREGIDNIERLRDLLRHPEPFANALRGISNVVGRAALNAERPGENILELISEMSGFEGGVFATPGEWIQALSAHLSRLEGANGQRRILASQEVIEGTLWMLRQLGDARQELLEARLTDDGTLRRFNADYLNDLRSTTPRGFNAILREYATAQVESDALRNAARRLNNRIVTLEERRNNLNQAVDFLNQHDADPQFVDFGKAVQEHADAISAVEHTEAGPVITYKHPITGQPVEINYGFDKVESLENIQRLEALANAGLEYAARPDANPTKAAYWRNFADQVTDYMRVLSPHRDVLEDPLFDPVKRLLSARKFALISETSLSRIPGVLALQATRAGEAFGHALKAKNSFEKDVEQGLINANRDAWLSHTMRSGLLRRRTGMTFHQWRDEVAGPIIDSRQHYGQTPYHVGDRIAGYGHVVTSQDMKAIEKQYAYDQYMIRLAYKSGYVPAIAEAPGRIKDIGLGVLRRALSQGPGTTTRFLPEEARRLPEKWEAALRRGSVNAFLSSNDNYVRLALGHVLEGERNYFQLGQGRFARDYRFMREHKQTLERTGSMPQNIDDLSQYIAGLHNEHLAEGEAPATAGDVRQGLIDEIGRVIKQIKEDNARMQTQSKVDIISHENEYTQPRGAKIAPGTLYRYGTTDRIDMIRKGNNAIEFYVVNYRDRLKNLQTALLAEREELRKTLNAAYGSEGAEARKKGAVAIRAGDNPMFQKHQMAMEELNRDIDRIGKLLDNAKAIIGRREEFYGDDIANRLFSPWFNSLVNTVLLGPATMIRNGASGSIMWALKTADVRNGGWLNMPLNVVKDHLKTVYKTTMMRRVPKGDRERIAKSLMEDLTQPAVELAAGILRDIQDREMLKRGGVIDTHRYRDALGLDSELPFLQNVWRSIQAMRELRSEPTLSARKEIYNTLGMIPKTWLTITRKIGQRPVDNWINVRASSFANAMADTLRTRAIQSFDGRLENDPVFRQIYEQYGDNYKQFEIALTSAAARTKGDLLTPAELTGRSDVPGFNIALDKSAVQIRRLFERNNNPIDQIMLKYWWNQRNARGDRNAPFMTQAQRFALQFVLAEEANMGTPTTRPTYFMGSKDRQFMGVLNQWWLWNADRLSEMFAKVRGQKTLGVRYAPAAIGFALTTVLAGLVAESLARKANDAAYNTINANPDIADAETDEERAKIATSIAANYWGAIGSLVKMWSDSPGKLGYRNPLFYVNFITDLLGTASKIYQSHDLVGPTLDLFARYSPPARAFINRMPSREGIVDVRNAANALRAATPDSVEAKKRQPSSGTDIRATTLTPLYNAILNSAVTGDWVSADENFQRAVEQARAAGNPNPEASIVAAIKARTPESSVFQRALTPEERDAVYGRLSTDRRALVDRVNAAFDAISARYAGGGAAGGGGGGSTRTGLRAAVSGGGGAGGGISPSFGYSAPRLSLGLGASVGAGFRTRSLVRRGRLGGGLRMRKLARGGLRQRRVGRRSRLRSVL